MKRFTQKELRALVNAGRAEDLTTVNSYDLETITRANGGFIQIGYAAGLYGLTGLLLESRVNGSLYTITARNSNLFALA